jgi:hypothetical protein
MIFRQLFQAKTLTRPYLLTNGYARLAYLTDKAFCRFALGQN